MKTPMGSRVRFRCIACWQSAGDVWKYARVSDIDLHGWWHLRVRFGSEGWQQKPSILKEAIQLNYRKNALEHSSIAEQIRLDSSGFAFILHINLASMCQEITITVVHSSASRLLVRPTCGFATAWLILINTERLSACVVMTLDIENHLHEEQLAHASSLSRQGPKRERFVSPAHLDCWKGFETAFARVYRFNMMRLCHFLMPLLDPQCSI